MSISRLGAAAAIAVAAVTGIAFSISASQPESTHLILEQDAPQLEAIALQQGESSLGDLLLFNATFEADDGSINGILTGSLLVVAMPDSPAEGANSVQSRLTHLVFNVEGKGTIVVGGSAVYPVDSAAEMVAGQPQVRAITGGTGEFIGASGELTSVRHEDGTYTHDFTLLN